MSHSPSLPALIIGAALLAGCTAPVGAGPTALDTRSPTASASPVVAATDPTPVPTTSPPPVNVAEDDQGGDSVPIFAGTVVQTLADDGLRMRARPSTDADSYKYEPLLALGTPLLILSEPESGSGYQWYDVAPLVRAAASHGWVASMSREGEPWIEPAEFACPPLPTDMESLLELPPGVGVHCFPNTPITVKARLLSCNCDVDGPSYTPHWFSIGNMDLLMEPERTVVPQDYSDTMVLHLDPDGDHPDELPLGKVVEVTGVFDHPAASSCTFTEMDGQPVPDPGCRLHFAVTRLAVDGQ